MLTPLNADETLDEPSLRRLVEFLIGAGVHGIWAMGTTGEFAGITETDSRVSICSGAAHAGTIRRRAMPILLSFLQMMVGNIGTRKCV